jgi:hypothetical protein
MIDDASAIIVQDVAFAAAKILHKEESSVSSRAGRIAVGRVRHSVHEVYRWATPIFNMHIACPTNHSGIFIQNLLQELIAPDL